MNDKNGINVSIQGLRGMAALCVAIYHVFFRIDEIYLQSNSVNILHRLGLFGVCIFLILSGLYCSWKGEGWKQGIHFLCKRIKRLWVLYAVAIIIETCIIIISKYPQTINWKIFIENSFLITGFFNGQYIDGAHWYIAVIFAFYLIVTLLIAIKLSNKWYAYILWMVINTVGSILGIPYLSNFLGGRYIGAFCIGIATQRVANGGKKESVPWIVLIVISVVYSIAGMGIVSTILLLIAYGLVLIAYYDVFPLLRAKVLCFLGDTSYHIYLMHQTVAYSIEYKFLSQYGNISIFAKTVAFVIAIGVGILFYILDNAIRNKYSNFLRLKQRN